MRRNARKGVKQCSRKFASNDGRRNLHCRTFKNGPIIFYCVVFFFGIRASYFRYNTNHTVSIGIAYDCMNNDYSKYIPIPYVYTYNLRSRFRQSCFYYNNIVKLYFLILMTNVYRTYSSPSMIFYFSVSRELSSSTVQQYKS